MAKYTVSITADGSTKIADVVRPNAQPRYEGTVFVYGASFGGGTVTFQVSPDGGTTKITIPNPSGVALNVNTAFDFSLAGQGNNNQYMQLYATMTGSTNPTVTVDIFDNR